MTHESLYQKSKIQLYLVKWLVIAVVVVLSVSPLYAQLSFSGEVKDQQDQPVPFANVLLLHSADSTLVEGTISDEEGLFSLEVQRGKYILQIAMVGFNTYYAALKVSAATDDHFNTFQLEESVRKLDEVVVKGQKQLFEKEVDRTVVNVQSSVTSAGSTVLEVLEKSPGVVVNRQNNSIAINGKNGVLIMINGKISRLPTDAVLQMLNGMSSANIEKIELITTPPAKYDAEGNAGIIHLVMAENADLGTSGNIGLTGGYNSGETWGANGNINHRDLRFNTFVNYSMLNDRAVNQWNTGRYVREASFTRSVVSKNRRNSTTNVQNLQAGIEFNLSERIDINVLVSAYRRYFTTNDRINSENVLSPDTTFIISSDVNEINRWQSATASLGITHQLSDRQQLSVSLDYLYYHQWQPSNYAQQTTLQGSVLTDDDYIDVDKQTPIHFEVGSVDYINKLSENFSFEAGTKASMSQFTNNVGTSRRVDGISVIDPRFTNIARLDEKILAGYASANWQPGTPWSIQAGLRYEYTDTYMSTPEEEALVDREFGNFFPTLAISREINEVSKLHLAINRRITRPTYNDLAPFVFFVNPTTVLSGNLNLLPAISDGVDLSYQRKQWWVSLKYNYVQNAMAPFQPEIDPETDFQVLRSQNLDYQRSYGIHTALPIAITDWWDFRNDLSLNYFSYATQHLNQNISRELLSFTYNGTHTILLAKGFSAEVTSYYQSASNWGMIHLKPLGRLDIGLKKQFKDHWGTISIVGTDLLNSTAWRGDIQNSNPDAEGFFSYNFGMRGVRVTYSKTFGNQKLREVNIRSGSEAERQRVQ